MEIIITTIQFIKDNAENIFDVIIPFVTLFAGYYLGKRDWKKQFSLENFDLHEKVLARLTSVMEDEIEGHIFKESDQEIRKAVKNKKIMPASEYFSEIKKYGLSDNTSAGYPYGIVLSSIENILGDLNKLSVRSNKKIYSITVEILKIYRNETKCLDFDIEALMDIDPIDGKISKEDSSYLDYLKREREELILLKIVPLVSKLKTELENFLKSKE